MPITVILRAMCGAPDVWRIAVLTEHIRAWNAPFPTAVRPVGGLSATSPTRGSGIALESLLSKGYLTVVSTTGTSGE
ncbi:hypothetical protein GCM10010341_24450 [Streptomyces noursei]|nr:hypothetical protein GCM10010341_24450 [Streptomyces noursei]